MSKSIFSISVLLLLVIAVCVVGDYLFFGRDSVSPPQTVSGSSHGMKPRGHTDNVPQLPERIGAVLEPEVGLSYVPKPAKPDRETMMAAYREKLADIKTYLEQQKFDCVAMKKRLWMKLKAAENGKLSEEEILSLLPQEIAEDFREMMDLLMQLSEMDYSSPLNDDDM